MKITNISEKVVIVHDGKTYKRLPPKEVMEIGDKPGLLALSKFPQVVPYQEKVIKKAPKKGLDKKLERMED